MSEEREKLKVPLGEGDAACGENCEYDELYLDLDKLAVGEAARVMGESVIEGKDPDWRGVRKNALALWQKTRDLRVAVYLALSDLALDGFVGLADMLDVVLWLFVEQWDGVWPRLDPDDDNDPMERMNIVAMLSPPQGAFDDPIRFVQLFRRTRLVPVGPKYTLRDLLIAEGELDAGEEKVDGALLTAEITGVPEDVIAAQAAAVDRIADLSRQIVDTFAEKTQGQYVLSFQTLLDELKPLKRFYAKFNHAAGQSVAEADMPPGAEPPVATGVASRGGAVFDLASYRPQTRSDALALLKKGCEYFRTTEPTSPVPYFVERALRMADMSFMDLLTEIDPSGVDRGRDILGVRSES